MDSRVEQREWMKWILRRTCPEAKKGMETHLVQGIIRGYYNIKLQPPFVVLLHYILEFNFFSYYKYTFCKGVFYKSTRSNQVARSGILS